MAYQKSIAWDTGDGYIKLTYGGSGNGTITVESDANTLGTSRSKTITIQTVGGAVTKNLTVSQAACPFPVGEVRNYSYTGSFQEVELPAGKYKLQCWGAQGGSNAANSTYGITAKAGGKGGYSEGIITLTQKTTVRVYVGGQGSSSAGGYNGGGSTTGSSQKQSSNFGITMMGGGGGASDIRLSDGSLYSRMIVAGGGSGGAMSYKQWNTSETINSFSPDYDNPVPNGSVTVMLSSPESAGTLIDVSGYQGTTMKAAVSSSHTLTTYIYFFSNSSRPATGDSLSVVGSASIAPGVTKNISIPSSARWMWVQVMASGVNNRAPEYITLTATHSQRNSQVGYVGGGTSGGGYQGYIASQNAAGYRGSFGQGANQTSTDKQFCGGAGGGGWYGGGTDWYDTYDSIVQYSGGGSGWVNIAANAGNRPSGYTGLQLDSGTTYAGNTSFPSTNGGTETGHSGNGYARITRLE